MPMLEHVKTVLEIVGWIIALPTSVYLLVLLSKALNGKATLEKSRETAAINSELAEAYRRELDKLKADVASNQQMLSFQDKRIRRNELEQERKDREAAAFRIEIQHLERIVAIVLRSLNKLSEVDRCAVEREMRELEESRRRIREDRNEWEATKDAMAIYQDGDIDREAVNKGQILAADSRRAGDGS